MPEIGAGKAKPYVIAINAVSGGGKTALARLLQESLPASMLFCFDDFDETNKYPQDYFEWWKRGAKLLEFDCQGMRDTLDSEIQRGKADYIILDYPFGRDHPRFQDVIDLSVYVDTPLDVAMARCVPGRGGRPRCSLDIQVKPGPYSASEPT